MNARKSARKKQDSYSILSDFDPPEENPNGFRYRLLHFPQVPCQPFGVESNELSTIKMLSDILARYDLFLLDNGFREDFSNDTFFEQWTGEEWEELDEKEF